ncbi:competence/damage-inducible protein A [Caldicoprobacter algeriensis]|uniref:competence/damage-inducible protein A n=1 Tax=Caldicoprobacter algeriensis TaxID=699281 RepID=UPI002079A213|nr:competence/damage-inducible protein A [Caldicoprobacter algeriensis]MCM8900802.1 competence/damage-inducible protein A [Caldicoprobacter algeriensis]
MDAEIIAVGSELLLGQIANTNAQYISQRLSSVGVNVYYHTVVGDNRKRLLEALEIACKRADIIITTGGLGPTMDDLTKETIAEFLGLELVLHQPSAQAIREFFARRGRTMTENNLKQAMFPREAIILPNDVGTAPGAIIEKDSRTFIMLPGPPYEMQPMFENHVIPYLAQKGNEKIFSRVLRIYGIGESAVEEMIKDLLENQTNPTIAPLAAYGEVTLRLTVKCHRSQDPLELMKPVEDEIRRRLGQAVYGVDDDRLETVVARLLKEKGLTLAVAESCTGGLISNLLTDVPGISENLLETCVTYSNQAKINRLGVKPETLEAYGAVSPQTAQEMAEGILKTSGADIGLAVTGIAGPGGGSPEKPVGLVYIAIAMGGDVEVKRFRNQGDRKRIKLSTANTALDLLRRKLLEL